MTLHARVDGDSTVMSMSEGWVGEKPGDDTVQVLIAEYSRLLSELGEQCGGRRGPIRVQLPR